MSYISSKTVRLSQLELRDLSKLTKILFLFQMHALSTITMEINRNNTQVLIFHFLRFIHQLTNHYSQKFLLKKLVAWSYHMVDRGRRENETAYFIEDTVACLFSYNFRALFDIDPNFDRDFSIFTDLDSVNYKITDCLTWKPSDLNDLLLNRHKIPKDYQHESDYSLMNSLRTNVITKFMLLEEVLESLTAIVFKSIPDLWDAIFDICGVMAIVIWDYKMMADSSKKEPNRVLSFYQFAIETGINTKLQDIIDDLTVVRFNHDIPSVVRRIRNLSNHRFKKYTDMRKNCWKWTYHVVPTSLISIYTTQFYCANYARKSRV